MEGFKKAVKKMLFTGAAVGLGFNAMGAPAGTEKNIDNTPSKEQIDLKQKFADLAGILEKNPKKKLQVKTTDGVTYILGAKDVGWKMTVIDANGDTETISIDHNGVPVFATIDFSDGGESYQKYDDTKEVDVVVNEEGIGRLKDKQEVMTRVKFNRGVGLLAQTNLEK